MELINATRMAAGINMGLEASGRKLLVVVIKGTFRLPQNDSQSFQLAEEQLPLVMADTFTADAGSSAPVSEVDFAPRKKNIDVLLNGSAYTPEGQAAQRVPVSLKVGNLHKQFSVVGNRHWEYSMGGAVASEPEPFTVMPISYDNAFGGFDDSHQDPRKHIAFMSNPVGRGFFKHAGRDWLEGKPLPNTEQFDQPILGPGDRYRPMSFGSLGRGWEPRIQYAGTYDDDWMENHFPFLPPDFDERYYQAAPQDQQLSTDPGGQEVVLNNLTPDGLRRFILPAFEAPVHIFPKKGGREDLKARLDTLVFEPDQQRYTMTWRVTRPLKRNMYEVAQVLVGKQGNEWWQQREGVSYPLLDENGKPRKSKPDCGCGKKGGCGCGKSNGDCGCNKIEGGS